MVRVPLDYVVDDVESYFVYSPDTALAPKMALNDL